MSKAPSGLDEQMELLLRVSIKEALYKALHPLLRPVTIRWHSVQVLPKRDGSCEVVATDLEEQVGRRMQVAASWRIREGFFVATASAHALPPGRRWSSGRLRPLCEMVKIWRLCTVFGEIISE